VQQLDKGLPGHELVDAGLRDLAADALAGFSGGAAVFRAVAPSFGARPPADPAACGCEATAADALTGHG
jgi:hypothetical protein